MTFPGWYTLGPDGEPVGPVDFETYLREGWPLNDERRVAFDILDDGSNVSTIFLGLDDNWDPDGPPLLYETMAFDPDGGRRCCRRTPSRVAALACHDQFLAEVRAKLRSP